MGMTAVKKIDFTAKCYLEGSWGARDIGVKDCSMELFDDKRGYAMIEFVAGEHVEHIGITYDPTTLSVRDYDGVFSIPGEGIELLKSLGFNTSEVE